MMGQVPPGIYDDMAINHDGITLTKDGVVTIVPRIGRGLVRDLLDRSTPGGSIANESGPGFSTTQKRNRGRRVVRARAVNKKMSR